MQGGELDAVVDALGLDRVVDGKGADPLAVGACDPDHVGEVELALSVVGRQPRETVAQGGHVERVDAGVDLADRLLGRRRVLLLDDRVHGAVGTADDAAVAGRLVELRGQHGHGVALLGVVVDERAQGLGGEQRDVAVGHDDGAGQVGQLGERALHGVTGAALLVLHRRTHLGGDLAEVGDHLVAAVADDDNEMFGVERFGRLDRVADQASSADGVQHLGDRRLHPGALARGEDHHGGRAGGAHAGALLGGTSAGGPTGPRIPATPRPQDPVRIRTPVGSRARTRTSITSTKGATSCHYDHRGTARVEVTGRAAAAAGIRR